MTLDNQLMLSMMRKKWHETHSEEAMVRCVTQYCESNFVRLTVTVRSTLKHTAAMIANFERNKIDG